MPENNNLSNFYEEFSCGSEKFKFLMGAYQEIFNMLYGMADQTLDNLVVPDIGTYRYIPIQSVKHGDSIYDLKEILIDKSIVDAYGMSSMSLTGRINYWTNEMSIDDKISILDVKKKYIFLATERIGDPDKRIHNVIDFKLKTDKGVMLIKNVDYVCRDNKIYILKKPSEGYREADKLILTDIAIDYEIPERTIGKSALTPYKDFVTKNEYRDIVQILLYVGLGGPTLRNLNETLNTLTGSGRFKVIDKPSAEGHYKTFWDSKVRGGRALSGFDFLIMSPPDVVNDTGVLKMVTDYLNIIKLSYTDFYISPYIEMSERYRINKLLHTFDKKLTNSHADILTHEENLKITQRLSVPNEGVWEGSNEQAIYDSDLTGSVYDSIISYDTKPNLSEFLRYMDSVLVAHVKALNDKITARTSQKFTLNLKNDGYFDKIIASEEPNKLVGTNHSDKINNAGTIYLYDNDILYDSDAGTVIYDIFNGSIDDSMYYDTIDFKLIKKTS